MMFLKSFFLAGATLSLTSASAILTPLHEATSPKGLFARQQPCTNGPDSRNCWDGTYDISTDSEVAWPTGKVVSYTLEISERVLQSSESPDGTPLTMLLINGTYPGPTLTADWGDELEITVINNMPDNGTSIHWHGFVQKNTNIMDGVNGVTECPIKPNGQKVYRFRATQHGTTWYHSHYSAQYGDGVVGTIIINGPASADYEIDLGTFPISDFYYQSMYQLGYRATHMLAAPPTPKNLLLNGTNENSVKAGKKNVTPLTPGKRHRLRIINTSVDEAFYVSLDNHFLQVIEADFVPIQNYNTTQLFVGIGQRYDVIIHANQTSGNYWFRATLPTAGGCGGNENKDGLTSIFNYIDVPVTTPATTISPGSTVACNDEPLANLKPYTKKSVDSAAFDINVNRNTHTVSGAIWNASTSTFSWNIDGNPPIDVSWTKPTLSYVAENNNNFPAELKVYDLPNANEWVFWIINNLGGNAHPIHLHGHDFHILGQKPRVLYSASERASLNFIDPPRRDVAMLPASGYLVLAFKTDNPGAWLMHCHIAWHVSQGLAVQFLERKSEIATTMNLSHLNETCTDWDNYYITSPHKKEDSGL